MRIDAFVEGKAEGIAEGIAEGMAKGMAEGEFNAKCAMALTMLNENFADEIILKFSTLTPEELVKIKAQRQ